MSKKTKKSATARAAKKASTKTPATTSPATPTPSPSVRDSRLPAVGTSLTREYKGKTLKVTFRDAGVEVDGRAFNSLSAAARHVTGAASINGYLFFRLTSGTATSKPTATATKKHAAPPAEKVGEGNSLGTLAGQREALRSAGIVGKSSTKTPASKSKSSTKGA
jgi:hypothetical protein